MYKDQEWCIIYNHAADRVICELDEGFYSHMETICTIESFH
jgi:hypothetical protein